tara:strand:+ start:359 stop:514 length:156 start_codon:yes stop_codon:yes gene_type:complete
MSKEFKLTTAKAPGIGLYLAADNSSRYYGLMLILPFLSIAFYMKRKDITEL